MSNSWGYVAWKRRGSNKESEQKPPTTTTKYWKVCLGKETRFFLYRSGGKSPTEGSDMKAEYGSV